MSHTILTRSDFRFVDFSLNRGVNRMPYVGIRNRYIFGNQVWFCLGPSSCVKFRSSRDLCCILVQPTMCQFFIVVRIFWSGKRTNIFDVVSSVVVMVLRVVVSFFLKSFIEARCLIQS